MKKKLGEENILSKMDLIFQKLSSEPKPTTMKFTREGPRDFVEYNYDEILLENIKDVCTQHFKEKRNCDVLQSVYLKCHFVSFDKLKYEIRNKVLIFVSKLKLRHKTSK